MSFLHTYCRLLPVVVLPAIAAACSLGSAMAGGGAARSILERALRNHGGSVAIRESGGLTLELSGERVMVDQSRRADPPWDREPSAVRILFDGPNGRWLWESISHYPGLGAFGSRRVFTDTGGFEIDVLRTGHGIEVMPVDAEGAARARLEIGRFIPGVLLEQALASPGGTSLVGRRESPEGRVDVVRYTDHRGREVRLLIQSATSSLVGFEMHRPDTVWGDAFDSVAFTGLRRTAGLGLPERRAEFTNGALVRELNYHTSVGEPGLDSLFAVPPGYEQPGHGTAHHHMETSDGEVITALAPGAWIDSRSGAVVAEFEDHLVVFDCPNDFATSQATLDGLGRRFPEKPVKYLVASHTHPDHCGGARAYYQAHVAVIAAEGHTRFHQPLADARHTIAPDPYNRLAHPPRLEPLAPGARRVLEDRTQRVELFNVGPSPHSEETIIALLPTAGLLWQVDLFLAPMTGPMTPARPVSGWLARQLDSLKLDFDRIIDTHMGSLYSRAQFDESLRLAGYRPLRELSAIGYRLSEAHPMARQPTADSR